MLKLDFKNIIKKFKSLPIYKLISNTGPRHSPEFKVAVKLKNTKYINGIGSSKKAAEQEAAKEFLKILKMNWQDKGFTFK